MFGLEIGGKNLLQEQWQGTLSDYVTAIAWSPTSEILAASSAIGEVMLWMPGAFTALHTSTSESVDSLAFSPDGQFLAAGGQDGQVRIWHLPASKNFSTELRPTILPSPHAAWVEKLAWSPINNQLAFSSGRSVQIWDAAVGKVIASLDFAASSVLGIHWRPDGEYLAVCGHRGVKVWNTQNWADPYSLDIRAASIAIAWSTDNKYLASGNMDRTLTVLEWNNPDPWVMRGFAGKIRATTWSEPLTLAGAPLLAASCAQSITVWEKQQDEARGWVAKVLDLHEGIVQAIAFQPGSFLLASASDDGYLCLWQDAEQVAQILEGVTAGFSCLAWHPQGQKQRPSLPLLAAGSQNGELLIWAKAE